MLDNQTTPARETSFFGHPRGLATLFFTEFWERFSYYGMRALLILFMTAPTAKGGLGFDVASAGHIYGLYTAMVYMTGLPGGWIADNFLGQRRAVLIGGSIIALGHFSLALQQVSFFYLGLLLIVIGTGLLKPNMSTMVGGLYSEGDARRDAGFSIFYMGINLGAMLAPLVCGYLGQKINWHLGFAAAGIGMTLGLIQYVMGGRLLYRVGLSPTANNDPATKSRQKRQLTVGLTMTALLIIVMWGLQAVGVLRVSIDGLTEVVGILLVVLPFAYFAWIFYRSNWSAAERKRLAVIAILFVFSALFWSANEQAGSTLNLFADRYTQNSVLGFSFPSSWFQSVNPIFIILLAPVFAWLWVRLGRRDPSSAAKFAMGLFFTSFSFLVLVVAALLSGSAQSRVSPTWLILVYLLQTIGELCLSPVGLSMVTKVAPRDIAGQVMGVWFLSNSVGNFVSGELAGFFQLLPLPVFFGLMFVVLAGAGLVLSLFVNQIRRLMEGVH